MLTLLTSCLQVIVTLTMPPPDWPSTSMEPNCSWSLRMFSCICWACFINPASCALIRCLRYWEGLIEDSTIVASKFSTKSRTNASWLTAAAARSRAVLPVVSLIVTVSRMAFPK